MSQFEGKLVPLSDHIATVQAANQQAIVGVVDDTSVDPDEPSLGPAVVFDGYVKSYKALESNGHMVITIAVAPDNKYKALPITDVLGTMLRFDVREWVMPDEGEDD